MFIKLLIQTAGQGGLSPELITYSQNASSSYSTMSSPSRVMLGASLCGIQSQKNRLLKSISLIVLGAVVFIIFTILGFLIFE